MPSYIKSPNHIHIVFDDGQSTTIYKSQPKYPDMIAAILAKSWDVARDIAFPSIPLVNQLNAASSDITQHVRIDHGVVMLDGEPVHGTLVDRMLAMADEGFDVVHMATFLENLLHNESYRAVTELYGFLEQSNLPITTDGHFLAYKRVDGNFRDIRTQTFDNSPGRVVEMPRNQVDGDKDVTCSAGLHFCSHDYLSSYANVVGNKTIIVKINPRDVVAIPTDYNNAKGRCCRYVVVGELDYIPNTAMPTTAARIEHKLVVAVQPGAVRQIQLDSRFPNLSLVLMTHDSIAAASDATGINKAAIKRVCNGHRKSTGGFGWKWAVSGGDGPLDNDDAYSQEQDAEAESDLGDGDAPIKLWSIT